MQSVKKNIDTPIRGSLLGTEQGKIYLDPLMDSLYCWSV